MLEFPSGMIGLPLRLLAREIYDRVTARVGEDRVALVTGEEKRVPKRAAYWICTTEAMPLTREVDFLAVDEVQLATHDERGHVFTDRLLHARGRQESWFLGSHTMSEIVARLVPAARQERHPRLSRLTFAGKSSLGRLPPRTAVIAFSLPELYAIAGRLKALRGGVAVVLGALSPRTRNAQVGMFQAGEVDYLVATDAIGMGLNLDLNHVAFASLRKFDGRASRALDPAELAQIAGRAGRYLRDGTFGTLSPLELPSDVTALIEQHRFEPIRRVRYRNSELDFTSPEALVASLEARPPAAYLSRVPDAVDLRSLRALLTDPEVLDSARTRSGLERLWAVCEIPDYRQILFEVHVGMLREIHRALAAGPLSDDFMRTHTADLSGSGGDVDALLAALSRLRTWAYVVNRSDWLASPGLWRESLAALEIRLSDALHEGLVSTFVERTGRARTRPSSARIGAPTTPASSSATVDRHHPFARLELLRTQVREVAPPTSSRQPLEELVDAPHEAFQLDAEGTIRAGGVELGVLARGAALKLPDVRLAPLHELPAGTRMRLHRRLLAFARDTVGRTLGPLAELGRSTHPPVRAIAYQMEQHLGCARRGELKVSIDALEPAARQELERSGVVLGALTAFVPALLGAESLARRAALIRAHSARARIPALGPPQFDASLLRPEEWLSAGYLRLGPRACRVDLIERAAMALRAGRPLPHALRCLALPRRDAPRVAHAIRALMPDSSAALEVPRPDPSK